jgi:16S rRNA (uracil1498-N3)-methyltransferase
MSRPRFFHPDLTASMVVLAEAETRHARHSLRLRERDAVELFDGRGTVATGEIAAAVANGSGKRASRTGVPVRIMDREVRPRPAAELTLIVGGCKGPRLEWLVEKCTELGVGKLILAQFERSVVAPGTGHVEKLRRIAIEACKQCGRNWLPDLESDVALMDAVRASGGHQMMIAHPGGTRSISDALGAPASPCTAVIGPEGGLTDAELTELMRHGGICARLAPAVLRVETAAVAVAAVWAAKAAGDLSPDSAAHPAPATDSY